MNVDVAVACRVLGVSRSGYYDWLGRPLSPREQENKLILKYIHDMRTDRRASYGSPRVRTELHDTYGLTVNRKRAARIMREAGLQGLYKRRRRGCTVSDPTAETFPDLVDRNFTAQAPDQLWVLDITEHPTKEGKVYCAAVMDVYSTSTPASSSAGPSTTTCGRNW